MGEAVLRTCLVCGHRLEMNGFQEGIWIGFQILTLTTGFQNPSDMGFQNPSDMGFQNPSDMGFQK